MTMQVVECNICGEPLAAATDEELLRRLQDHVGAEHAATPLDEDQAREMIAREAYAASDS